MWPFLGVQTLEMFSGVYAVPTIILMKLCCFLTKSIFKHVYMVGMAITTVICMVNLQLGYYQPADHYILGLRPEYGDDIVEIASSIFHSFTDQLPFLLKAKRRFRRGQMRKFIKKRGWRLVYQRRRKVFGRNTCRATDLPVKNSSSTVFSPPEKSTTDAVSTLLREAWKFQHSVQDSDMEVDTKPLIFQGQSSCMLESSDGTLIPEAQRF